jgi:ribokinase
LDFQDNKPMTGSSDGAAEIVVLGIFAADLVFRAGRLPAIGETLIGHGFSIGAGGKGSNQAIAVARAGGRVGLITRVGADTFGALARSVWQAEGVADKAITTDPEAPTGAAFIFVNALSGENAIIVTPGAAGKIGPGDITSAETMISQAKVFITQLEQPVEAAYTGLRAAKRHGLVTIFNPAPATALPEDIWTLCDWITPNETEAGDLTGVAVHDAASALRAARQFRQKGVQNVVVTLGGKGAFYYGEEGAALVPPLPDVIAVDTAGAGDAFNAGFAVALAEGRKPGDALRFASAAAGLAVGRAGTAAAMPARAEIDAAFARMPLVDAAATA